jgi:phosphoenolpyruvate carboxykinase (ATP)
MTMNTQQAPDLGYLGLRNCDPIFYQLSPARLVEAAIKRNEGILTDTGALAVDTGELTGRSPKDRFIVDERQTHKYIWWGAVNSRFDAAKFDALHKKMTAYLSGKEVFVRDASACANEKYHLSLRVVTETAYQNLFAHHLFIRPGVSRATDRPDWTVIAAPGFMADPKTDGTRQGNFTVICFSKKLILVGGTGYTGEIKKAVFSVLNFILPAEHGVLPMHCSANRGAEGDTAIFFGLSGTGKTTLSADPERGLIGDDEHGWSPFSLFNFEGGCYAKCAGLSAEKEPEIFRAISYGALLENVGFLPGSRRVNFADTAKTENTRVAYPLSQVENAVSPAIGAPPRHIFFLTADAFGILPPIARLSPEQAMYHFVSGYTAKIAGTEAGIAAPQATFSACFGEAFLPLHPMTYARLLGQKIKDHGVNVWLVNTGWTGGPYGSGSRMKLPYTRAMITAALNGGLEEAEYHTDPVFGLAIPAACPGVPESILDPRRSWPDPVSYDQAAHALALRFTKNFDRYAGHAEIAKAGPVSVLAGQNA